MATTCAPAPVAAGSSVATVRVVAPGVRPSAESTQANSLLPVTGAVGNRTWRELMGMGRAF